MTSIPAAMSPPPLKYQPCRSDGLVSAEALRIIVEAKACFVAVALALAYFLTASQHRLWSSSHLVKGFLFAVTQPVTRFLVGMFTMLLAMPFRNDLYLLWGILLLAGYEGVYTISGYGVSCHRSDLAVHEFARGYNIVLLGLYVRYYSRSSQFRHPLWALWALMVARFLERLVRFKIAKAAYGDGNTSLVADYMKYEHELTKEGSPVKAMEDCNYLITGDSDMKQETVEGNAYEAKLTPADSTVTVSKVWKCQGPLLASKDGPGDRLKDVCLSFALCKLLRRKFTGVPAADGERTKAQRLVFDELLSKDDDAKRAFRVMRVELGFARDLMYTKYPILFSCGFPVVSAVLFVVTIGVLVWIAASAIRHYRVPHGSTANIVDGKNVDLLITFAILGMVTGMEICEFFMHLFSDWTKVMVLAEYVRKPHLQQSCILNNILRFICCGKIVEPIGSSLGQLNLLTEAKKTTRIPGQIVNIVRSIRSFVLLTTDESLGVKKGKTITVPEAVNHAICQTLMRNRQELLEGRFLMGRQLLESYPELAGYCRLPSSIRTIMVWHVATCEMETRCPVKGSNVHYQVATTLSTYLAYLVFYKPKLLPITKNSVRYTCKQLVQEAREGKGADDDSMVKNGRTLATEFMKLVPEDDGRRWEELAELWSELMVCLAPAGNISAHQKELGSGGEFITHLWALLYHASLDDKFSGSSVSGAGDQNGRDDHFNQAPLCSAGPSGYMV